MRNFQEFCLCLVDQKMMPTVVKVAVVVGSILFVINHGSALVKGQIGGLKPKKQYAEIIQSAL